MKIGKFRITREDTGPYIDVYGISHYRSVWYGNSIEIGLGKHRSILIEWGCTKPVPAGSY